MRPSEQRSSTSRVRPPAPSHGLVGDGLPVARQVRRSLDDPPGAVAVSATLVTPDSPTPLDTSRPKDDDRCARPRSVRQAPEEAHLPQMVLANQTGLRYMN